VVVAVAVLFVVGFVAATGAAGLRLGVWLYGPPEAVARLTLRLWLPIVGAGAGLIALAAILGLAA